MFSFAANEPIGMVNVYALALADDAANEVAYQYLVALASDDTWKRIGAYGFRQDAYRSLFGEFLARFALYTDHSADKDAPIGRDANGKPYMDLPNAPQFNIAHSGRWVVCATHREPVGVDVEAVRPVDIENFRGHLSTEEYYWLKALPAAERLNRFFELWTLKECYIKQQGGGASELLSSFTVRISPGGKIDLVKEGRSEAHLFFRQYQVADGYAMAVCACEDSFTEIRVVTLQELMRYF